MAGPPPVAVRYTYPYKPPKPAPYVLTTWPAYGSFATSNPSDAIRYVIIRKNRGVVSFTIPS